MISPLPSAAFLLKYNSQDPPCLAERDEHIPPFEQSNSVHPSHHNEVCCCTEVFHSYMQYKQENKNDFLFKLFFMLGELHFCCI